MDDVLSLITAVMAKDKYGVLKPSYTSRQVYCQVHGITRAEFFTAGRSGLNPEYKFTVFSGDYNGEEACEFRGQSYAIYRAYHAPGTDTTELYVARKGGTNGITED
jgi:SPP1 family predicted phage head-tail adaptor